MEKEKPLVFSLWRNCPLRMIFFSLKSRNDGLGWSSGFFFPVNTCQLPLQVSQYSSHSEDDLPAILPSRWKKNSQKKKEKLPYSRHSENSWLHMTFYFCRLVTEEETIFSLRKWIYEIKSCLTVEFPKRFFCLPNEASVLYRQRKRREKKKKNKLGQN